VRTTFRFLAPDDRCSYLPDQMARMEYERFTELTLDEYADLMMAGWRRFGHTLFRPRCARCQACQSLRVDAARFRPNRSQRRARKLNEGTVTLEIGEPRLSWSRLDLYRRFHAERALKRGWSERDEDPMSYHDSFISNPFPTEEWAFRIQGQLVGLGLVDALPVGLSAIYFVHDPGHQHRGLGPWNILCMIEEARRRGVPHLYLGYWVAGCLSLAYKASFRPHEILGSDGRWRGVEPADPDRPRSESLPGGW
jgi:leucyl-tRNA---protein transferase